MGAESLGQRADLRWRVRWQEGAPYTRIHEHEVGVR